MPDYVNNTTIIYQVPRNYYKEYEVPGVNTGYQEGKSQGKKEKKGKKKKNETKTNTLAQGAGRVRRGQGCCLLVIRSVRLCVQLMNSRRTTKKGQTNTAKMRAETKPKKQD